MRCVRSLPVLTGIPAIGEEHTSFIEMVTVGGDISSCEPSRSATATMLPWPSVTVAR